MNSLPGASTATSGTDVHGTDQTNCPGYLVAGKRRSPKMNRLLIFVGITLGGWLGWWIGAKIGFMSGFIFSGIGSMIGIYVGWRINRDYFS